MVVLPAVRSACGLLADIPVNADGTDPRTLANTGLVPQAPHDPDLGCRGLVMPARGGGENVSTHDM